MASQTRRAWILLAVTALLPGMRSFIGTRCRAGDGKSRFCTLRNNDDGRSSHAASSSSWTSAKHRSPPLKAARRPVRRGRDDKTGKGKSNTQKLSELVSKTLRRNSHTSEDIVYDVELNTISGRFEAKVHVAALEGHINQALEFQGNGSTESEARSSAAAAALLVLPPAPDFEKKYPKPEEAAAWVAERLHDSHGPIEVDCPMSDVMEILAHLQQRAESLHATATFVLTDEHKSRLSISRGSPSPVLQEGVASMTPTGRTAGSALGEAMRARLAGDGHDEHQRLELRLAGRPAAKQTGIATKIVQTFLLDRNISFRARFEEFPNYRARPQLVVTVDRN